jgi:formylglycine-generating enzyme
MNFRGLRVVTSKTLICPILLMFGSQAISANAVAPIDNSRPAAQAQSRSHYVPGMKFRDCSKCPEMIVVPPGRFLMGATPDHTALFDTDGEQTIQHEVTVPKAFAAGIYDVTRAEYEAFAKQAGRTDLHACNILNDERGWTPDSKTNWRHPGFTQTGRDPVVCVSLHDARTYVAWLNAEVRKAHPQTDSSATGPYHLPTEAEWEYAARAGSQTRFFWGTNASRDNANYGLDPCCGVARGGKDRWDYTSPGDAFPPNKFGLYDMVGNVWEWTEGCGGDRWTGADGSTLTPGDCHDHVLRGGSWLDEAGCIEIQGRNPWPQDDYNYANGFRVFRSLDEWPVSLTVTETLE